VNRHKQRLQIKFGIDVRNEEIQKRKTRINDFEELMEKLENIVDQKILDFECMCKDTNAAAEKALIEADFWTRQRTKLQRPIVLLERDVTSKRLVC